MCTTLIIFVDLDKHSSFNILLIVYTISEYKGLKLVTLWKILNAILYYWTFRSNQYDLGFCFFITFRSHLFVRDMHACKIPFKSIISYPNQCTKGTGMTVATNQWKRNQSWGQMHKCDLRDCLTYKKTTRDGLMERGMNWKWEKL